MEFFLGNFEFSIDDKNRLNVPAKIRKTLGQMGEVEFVLSKYAKIYLTVYPYNIWRDKIGNKIKKLKDGDGKANRLRREIGKCTFEGSLDNQGRMLIPPDFSRHAGIDKKIRIVGCFDTLQLWDPATHDEVGDTYQEPTLIKELEDMVGDE